MKKLAFILLLTSLPLSISAQSKDESNNKHETKIISTSIIKANKTKVDLVYQVKSITHIKSEELISVNTFIKSLRLKRKKTVLS
jgi:hypothetical protein